MTVLLVSCWVLALIVAACHLGRSGDDLPEFDDLTEEIYRP